MLAVLVAAGMISTPTGATSVELRAAGGQLQLSKLGQEAREPLRVIATRNGKPAAGVPVTFSVLVSPGGGSVGGRQTITRKTDREGSASVVAISAIHERWEPKRTLQPLVVDADAPGREGPKPRFRIQALDAAHFRQAGLPAYLVPIGGECTAPTAAGDCPIARVGETLHDALGVLVVDASYRAVPDWPVSFATTGASFAEGSSVILRSDSQGLVRVPKLKLGTKITDPTPILLDEAERFATLSQAFVVRAWTDVETPRGRMRPATQVGAYAYPGVLADLDETASPPTDGLPGLPGEPIVVRALDRFGNPIANQRVTFTAGSGDARLFREDPDASSAKRCNHRLVDVEDSCVRSSISALSGPDGIAWVEVALGSRAGAEYEVDVRAASVRRKVIRRTASLAGMHPGQVIRVVQMAANAADLFAIIGTENNDEFHVTATTWEVACEADGSECGERFHVRRRVGDTVHFTATHGAAFRPSSAVTGSAAEFGVVAPEVGACLVGPPEATSFDIGLTVDFRDDDVTPEKPR